MHNEDDAESLQLVSENTRARARQQRENLGVTDNTLPGKHVAPPARAANSATSKQVTGVSALSFTAGDYVPFDYPLQLLPEIVFLRALVYHNLAFSAPKAWFAGVPLNADGRVTIHPAQAHKVSKKQAGRQARAVGTSPCPSSCVIEDSTRWALRSHCGTRRCKASNCSWAPTWMILPFASLSS
jgi:hypothetical protein